MTADLPLEGEMSGRTEGVAKGRIVIPIHLGLFLVLV
jgi:hypothetical protein